MAYDENWDWVDDWDSEIDLATLMEQLDIDTTSDSELGTIDWAGNEQELIDVLGGSDFDIGSWLSDIFNSSIDVITAGSSGSSNTLSNILKNLTASGSGVGGTGSTMGNILTGLGGLYGSYSQDQLADKQAELAKYVLNNADPYRDYRKNVEIPFMSQMLQNGQNAQGTSNSLLTQAQDKLNTPLQNLGPTNGYQFYNDQLMKSYTDPLSIYNSPEMKAINQKFMDQIERRDAASGRNSQYGARAVEAQNNFLSNTLPNWRSGLVSGEQGVSSAQGQANSAINSANQTQLQQGANLGSLFGNQSNYALNLSKLGVPSAGGASSGVEQFGNLMSQSNTAGTSSLTSALAGLKNIFGG